MATTTNRTSTHKASADAARTAIDHHASTLRFPGLGDVRLPPADQLAFLGGLGLLAALEIIEWPVAAVVAAGHALMANRNNRMVREFGDALEDA